MIFQSWVFIVLLVIALLGDSLIKVGRYKKFFLLIVSYLFYAVGNDFLVILIIISTLVDFYSGRGIIRAESVFYKRVWLSISLLCNLSLLLYFKYWGFLLENFSFLYPCLLYTSPSPRDGATSRMPSSA